MTAIPRPVRLAWASLAVALILMGIFGTCSDQARVEGPITREECVAVCAPCPVTQHSPTRCDCRNPRSLIGCEQEEHKVQKP